MEGIKIPNVIYILHGAVRSIVFKSGLKAKKHNTNANK
jgi:hypothetical protein